MNTISLERLREVLTYDQKTGIFIWNIKMNRRITIGSIAGSADSRGRNAGRVSIYIDGQRYFAHRLAWLYVHGYMPDGYIDHINGNPADNRISNLRPVTPMGNSQNRRKQQRGYASGLLGAAKGRRGNWVARIRVNRKTVYLGEFKTPELAHTAYVAAKRRLHPTCSI